MIFPEATMEPAGFTRTERFLFRLNRFEALSGKWTRFLSRLFALLLLFLCGGETFAQTVTGTASLAAPLENLEGSARDLALGSAFVGIADDSSALFFNPAGLSGLRNPDIALHHNSYLAGTFQETLAAGFPAGNLGGVAVALDYVGWGNLDLRDAYGASEGSFNDSDVGFTAGWGMEWFPGFSVGLAVRGLQQKVVNDLYTSLAGDAGLLWLPQKSLRLGISYLNFGTPVAGSPLAGELNGGGSALFNLNPNATLLAALAGSWTPGGVGSAQGGLEGVLDKQWALRLGYQLPFYDNQLAGLTGLTAGAGLKLSTLSLDYAYLPFGSLGASNRISLAFQFDLPKELVRVPVQVPVTVVRPAPVPPTQDVEVHFKISTDPLAQGQELEKEGKLKEAVGVYVDALKANPSDDILWQALAMDYYQLGEKAYAIQCFERVLQLKPDDAALKDWLLRYKGSADSP